MNATLYIASSLNGKMTEGETNSSWVSPNDEVMFAKTCADIGCILVGRKTFDQYQGVVYPVKNAVNIVLTSSPRQSNDPNVIYVQNLDQALAQVKQRGFNRFMVVGGANVIGQCLQQNLVDRIYLSLHPYIFGTGLSMIGTFAGNLDLAFQGIKHQEKDFVLMEYSVK